MHNKAIGIGALLAALAVILGAFAAHALKGILPINMLQVFETGVKYQFYHSIAVIISGMLFLHFPVRQLKLAISFFVIGIALFSGSLYAIAFSGIIGSIGPFGILTPIGGVFFILGWVLMAIGTLRKK